MKVQVGVLLICVVVSCVVGEESNRIFAGQNATEGQFPFHVQIRGFIKFGFTFLCGGSILNDEFVLTAGHCVKDTKKFQLYFGSHKYADYWDSDKLNVRTNQSFIHPNYSISPINYDIALIQLPKKLNFTDKIKPINLPKRENRSYEGENLIATGFGRVKDLGGRTPSILQYAYLEVISNDECRQTYDTLQSEMVCARGKNSESVCLGDSGGPLFDPKANELIGVTSFGHADGCEKGIPAGFVRTQSSLDWIAEITGIKID